MNVPTMLVLGALLQSTPPIGTKKASYLAAKRSQRETTVAAPRRSVTPVFARNLHTHEVMPLVRTEPNGSTHLLDEDRYRSFFRCWFTHHEQVVPSELVARVVEAASVFDVRRVHVVSGFRAPKYNLMLRKKGHEVAQKSQHTLGHAIDFALVGVQTHSLYRWLLRHHDGGVGFYPYSAFVHVDLGPKRTWRGR